MPRLKDALYDSAYFCGAAGHIWIFVFVIRVCQYWNRFLPHTVCLSPLLNVILNLCKIIYTKYTLSYVFPTAKWEGSHPVVQFKTQHTNKLDGTAGSDDTKSISTHNKNEKDGKAHILHSSQIARIHYNTNSARLHKGNDTITHENEFQNGTRNAK